MGLSGGKHAIIDRKAAENVHLFKHLPGRSFAKFFQGLEADAAIPVVYGP